MYTKTDVNVTFWQVFWKEMFRLTKKITVLVIKKIKTLHCAVHHGTEPVLLELVRGVLEADVHVAG